MANPTYQPKATVFDELEVKFKNVLSCKTSCTNVKVKALKAFTAGSYVISL